MTGKTHRVGGMLCCLGGYVLLESNGMLLGNVNPLLQLAVMYPFAIYGSVVSDLDHNWHSAPSKDVVSYGVNKVLHLTTSIRERMSENSKMSKLLGIFDARHRSWQTHSDLFLIAMLYVAYSLLSGGVSTADQVIIRLVFTGLVLGVVSHLFLDMLTPEGIWCLITTVIGRVGRIKSIPEKISLVPNTRFFRTGGTWENIIRIIMWVLCILLFLKILISISPFDIEILFGR